MGVWIDTDMGFDDIAALMMVSRSDDVIDGVSLVFGNTELDGVRRNAAAAAKAFGWHFPIHEGRGAPLVAPMETAANVLGDTGIRTVGRHLPEADELPRSAAFTALCDWLAAAPEPRRILALGPLTNIAVLALARPDLAGRVDELVWMGGGVTGGNHTIWAEFNAYADPEALAVVLAHDIPLRMVDLDLCRRVRIGVETIAPVRSAGGALAEYLADMLAGYVEIGTLRGRTSVSVYDAVAGVAFITTGIVAFQPATISVDLCASETRGRTHVAMSPEAVPNASCATDVDADRVREILLQTLLAEAAR